MFNKTTSKNKSERKKNKVVGHTVAEHAGNAVGQSIIEAGGVIINKNKVVNTVVEHAGNTVKKSVIEVGEIIDEKNYIKVVHTVENAGNVVGQSIIEVGGEVIGATSAAAGMIFITSGTGVIGYRVAKKLIEAGHPTIRIGTKNQNDAIVKELDAMGVDVAHFEWDDPATYDTALDGVRSVLCIPGYSHGWYRRFDPFLDACQKAGVRHFHKMSFYHANRKGYYFREVPLVKATGDHDNKLISSHGRMSYTILQASPLMSNPLVFHTKTLQDEGKFYGSSANKGVNYVSPNDIAEVAVRSLLDHKKHHNKVYSLTGPVAVKDEDVAVFLSMYIGSPVKYIDQPLKEFEDNEKITGEESEWFVRDMVALEKLKSQDVGYIIKDIERICGRHAESYTDYLKKTNDMSPEERYPRLQTTIEDRSDASFRV